MLTLAELKAEIVSNLLSDTDFYTDASLTIAINKAYKKLSEATLQYESTETQTSVQGQYIYALPTDCIKIKKVFFDNERLSPRTLDVISAYYDAGRTPETIVGTPTVYAKHSLSSIWLYATPIADKNIKIIYAAYAPDYSADTDIGLFGSSGDEYVINFVTAEKHRIDGEMEKYYSYKKDYETNMDHVRRAVAPAPNATDLDDTFEGAY